MTPYLDTFHAVVFTTWPSQVKKQSDFWYVLEVNQILTYNQSLKVHASHFYKILSKKRRLALSCQVETLHEHKTQTDHFKNCNNLR